jgi:2-methylcitrate dehydratase PrpD
MESEHRLVEFVCGAHFADVPVEVLATIKDQVLAVVGTTIGGASAEGCETLAESARDVGGKTEASILVHGGRVPAQQAAFVNGVMARALDYCDALVPGAHIGSATIPAALATSELVGGAGGEEFLAAVLLGTELALRLNLGESQYDGFDPTGVCVPFAATAAAARIMRLSEEQTWNALALAFNRCGGSFQSNVDGSLAVRVIEGWVAETGVTCARLAARGITGPRNFLEGVYGYFHLFGRDQVSPEDVLSGLGAEYRVGQLVFKKYPSCGATQGSTGVILDMMAEEGFGAGDVERVRVTVPPYIYKLVGHPFKVGGNPKVDAQFSIRYCVANALVRGGSKLAHFEAEAIGDPEVLRLIEKIEVVSDSALDERGHTALDMLVLTYDGRECLRKADLAPGFPGMPLSREEHLQRFRDCVAFAPRTPSDGRLGEIVAAVDGLEEMRDVRGLIALLTPGQDRPSI